MKSLLSTALFVWGAVSVLHTQCQLTITQSELYCNSGTTYSTVLDVQVENAPGDSVAVEINGNLNGVYAIDDFPLTFSEINQGSGSLDEIAVYVSNAPACGALITYDPPTELCADCFNYALSIEYTCNPIDSTYDFLFTPVVTFPEQMAPEGTILLDIDGQPYTLDYEIGGDYLLTGVPLNPGTFFHEIIYSFQGLDCGVSYLFLASPTCEPLCSVEELIVEDVVCTTDSTYNITVLPVIDVPEEIAFGFSSYSVVINGEYESVFSLEENPAGAVVEVPLSGTGMGVVEVCVFGGPDECCSTLEYNEPNCDMTNTFSPVAERPLKVYPNPARDWLTVSDARGTLYIHNTSGQLVFRGDRLDHPVDVAQWLPGLYRVTVIGETTTRTTKFIKY